MKSFTMRQTTALYEDGSREISETVIECKLLVKNKNVHQLKEDDSDTDIEEDEHCDILNDIKDHETPVQKKIFITRRKTIEETTIGLEKAIEESPTNIDTVEKNISSEEKVIPRSNINGYGERGHNTHNIEAKDTCPFGERCQVIIRRLTDEGDKYFQCFNEIVEENSGVRNTEYCPIHQDEILHGIVHEYENDPNQKLREDEYFKQNQIAIQKRKTLKKSSKNKKKKVENLSTKQCEWIFARGSSKGSQCPNKVVDETIDEIGKGEDRFCKNCIVKATVVLLLAKELKEGKKEKIAEIKISPTIPKMIEDMQESIPLFLLPLKNKKEFSLTDLFTLYYSRKENKTFNDTIHPDLKVLSPHWKYIIEVITSKEHIQNIPGVLLWGSDGKMKRMRDQTLWIKKEIWIETDKDSLIAEMTSLKTEIINRCLYALHEVKNNKDENVRLLNENILNISNKLKNAKSSKLTASIIKSFIGILLDENFSPEENPIGWDFIHDMIEFTDNETEGITTTELYEAREEWLKNNPDPKLRSYSINELSSFGRMVKKYKTWEIIRGKGHVTLHAGIKIREIEGR